MNETKTGKCGYIITFVTQFNRLYCYNYCCKHCPDAKTSPCQKEKQVGTVIDNLAKMKDADDQLFRYI